MKAFQLKMVIKDSKPPIWRRIIVPSGITFSQLSMILNEAMGWSGYHVFKFEFYHLELHIMEDVDDFVGIGPWDYREAGTTYIREYLEENDWFTYTYDLGDCWDHRVTVEKVLEDYEENYPKVIKYKGDCPVEDCGGIWGYYDCLDVIADPSDPEYEDRLAWMEMQGYPNEYDMEAVNQRLRERFFYKWGKGEKRCQSDIYEEHLRKKKYGLKATENDVNKDEDMMISGKHYLEQLAKRWGAEEDLEEIWKEELSQVTLREIMIHFDKDDLATIAVDKGLKGCANCRKEIVIDKLAAHMLKKEVLEKYLLCLTDWEVEAFEQAMHSSVTYDPTNKFPLVRIYEAGYLGVLEDDSVVVPADVAEKYHEITGAVDFGERRERISYLISCLRAAAILYGVAPVDILLELIHRNPKVHVTEAELSKLVLWLPPEFAEFVLTGGKFYHNVFWGNDRKLLQWQEDKEYYIPTLDEIRQLGTMGYLSESGPLQRFVDFLNSKLGFPIQAAEYFGALIQTTMSTGETVQDIMNGLEDEGVLEELGKKQEKELKKQVSALWEHTRMIYNRGFTPCELRLKGQRVDDVETDASAASNIIDLQAARKNKVYPNDPCPCGSGKKYKHCCGKR